MISMTEYWQQFQECLDNLPETISDELKDTLLNIASDMVTVGKSIEEMSLLHINGVSNQLQELSKRYNNPVNCEYEGKAHQVHLPKTNSDASLVFSILYYQHLCNYQQVEYQGNLWFGKGTVDKIVKSKRSTTCMHAQALLDKIKSYCENNRLIYDETQFLRAQNETISAYVQRMVENRPRKEQHSGTMSKLSQTEDKTDKRQPNEVDVLRQSLAGLDKKQDTVLTKMESLMSKLTAFHFAYQQYQQQLDQWQSRGLITKITDWFLSWFYTNSIAEQLKESQQTLNQSNEELCQLVGTEQNAGACLINLYQQVDLIHRQREDVLEKISQAQLITQPVNTQPVQQQDELDESEEDKQTTSVDLEQLTSQASSVSSLSDLYSFFKSHMPGRHALEAASVGLAGIAVQHLNGTGPYSMRP